ncbi:hypothetical protein ACFX12_003507 [Malus domestica]
MDQSMMHIWPPKHHLPHHFPSPVLPPPPPVHAHAWPHSPPPPPDASYWHHPLSDRLKKPSESTVSTIVNLVEEAKMAREGVVKAPNLALLSVCKSLVAGGVAGVVSRTAVTPLERLKILLQVHFFNLFIPAHGADPNLHHCLEAGQFLGLFLDQMTRGEKHSRPQEFREKHVDMLTTLLSLKDDADGKGIKLTDTEIKYVEKVIFKVLRAVAVSGSTTFTAYAFRGRRPISPKLLQQGDQKYAQYSIIIRQPATVTTNQVIKSTSSTPQLFGNPPLLSPTR